MGSSKFNSTLLKSTQARLAVFILIVIIIFATFITACAPKAQEQGPTNTTPQSSTTSPAASTPETIKIKFATWDQESAFSVPHYRWFAEELNKRTGGRVEMEIYLAAALGSTPELPENLQNGVADMAVFVPTHVPGLMPIAELMSVPMLIPTAPVMDYIGWHLISEGLLSLPGVRILEIMGHEDIVLCTSDRKVATLDDFKGLVLGTNGTWGPLCAKLGASEKMLPPPEIYTSVERGVVDGGPFGWGLPMTLKMEPILKYINSDPLGNDPWIIGINEDTWNSLPADIQVILLDLSREAGHKLRALITEQNQIAHDHFVAEPGIEVYPFAPGEYDKLVEIALPLAGEKAAQLDDKGAPATEALKIITDDLKALGTVK